MKNWMTVLTLGVGLSAASIAQAQEGVPGAAPPPVGDTTVTATTTTTTEVPATVGAETTDYGTMPATGGAPLAMALGGALTAAGAFFLRRKLS